MFDASDFPSTETELDNDEAYELGRLRPDQAWVLTDRDVWHKNPFYKGRPVPHPEDYQFDQDIIEEGQQVAAYADAQAQATRDEEERELQLREETLRDVIGDEDIPF